MTAISDLRAAVARADEVLGCGRIECLYCSVDDGLPGRCLCHVRVDREVIAALYKAAKAVVEKDEDRTDIAAAEKRLAEVNADPSLLVRLSPEQWELKTCWCFNCLDEPSMGPLNPAVQRMIACPNCGNKRCPRATSHDNACSGSNGPGQDGSVR